MKIVNPSVVILDSIDGEEMVRKIEAAGRTCYKSEAKITTDSANNFINNIIKRGHESVLEHEKISVRIICDRGVTHELVRHRIASYSQESTRYVDYKKGIEVIKPCFWEEGSKELKKWKNCMRFLEVNYIKMRESGALPQEARSILPNSLKTEIVCTMNLREWRHFFKLRCVKAAHPQMRELSYMILEKFVSTIPIVFDDIIESLKTEK